MFPTLSEDHQQGGKKENGDPRKKNQLKLTTGATGLLGARGTLCDVPIGMQPKSRSPSASSSLSFFTTCD
jgi:hypothetical protein